MSEGNTTDKPASVSAKKTLSLKGGRGSDKGQVRQKFSHGRTNTVVVEKKRKRGAASPDTAETVRTASTKRAPAAGGAPARSKPAERGEASGAPDAAARATRKSSGAILPTLSEHEREARTRALHEAKKRDEERRRQAEEDRKREAEEAEKRRREEEAAEARRREEEAKRAAEEAEAQKKQSAEADKTPADKDAEPVKESREAPKKAETTARAADDGPAKKAEADRASSKPVPAAPVRAREAATEEDERPRRGGGRGGPAKAAPARGTGRNEPKQRARKLTVTSAMAGDEERQRSLSAYRRQQERRMRAQQQPQERQKVTREVTLPDVITVGELANRMAERSADVVKELMKLGMMVTINQPLDADTAQLVVETMGHSVKRVSESDVEEGMKGEADAPQDLKPRAPVVTVMGHVDHGKTSLLDALRNADVVSGEAGGITQHIGAYQVSGESGQKITFIDTPGHAAFTAMRARGARATDIVILVVAADDGVMPQTIEAISHAKAAEVPIIVAINKMDKPSADPNRVRTELLQHEVIVESMSGEVQDVEVSALKKEGLDKLQDAILLQAEILELKANPDRAAEGIVIEAELDRGRGPVGTLLIQRGTLRVGDIVVAGSEWGKVRALIDDRGNRVEEAGPSVPVEVLGLNATPNAGDEVSVVESEARAREITEYRQRKARDAAGVASGRTLNELMAELKQGDKQELAVVVKSDVQGSSEAIVAALEKLGNDEIQVRVLHAAVGGITESDVTLAAASGAPVIAFNVRANKQARDLAERDGVEIRYYSVIYDLVDDLKAAMEGMLSPEKRETFIGYAEILEVFNISKVGKVAGCRVSEGVARREAGVRLLRDDVVIHEGKLKTLKRFKDEVKEVQGGQECGMAFENYHDVQKGDVIEIFEVEEVARKL